MLNGLLLSKDHLIYPIFEIIEVVDVLLMHCFSILPHNLHILIVFKSLINDLRQCFIWTIHQALQQMLLLLVSLESIHIQSRLLRKLRVLLVLVEERFVLELVQLLLLCHVIKLLCVDQRNLLSVLVLNFLNEFEKFTLRLLVVVAIVHDQVQSQVLVLSNKIVVVVINLLEYQQFAYLYVLVGQILGKPQNLLAQHLHLELLDERIAEEEFHIKRVIFVVFLLFFGLTCDIKFLCVLV